MFWNKDELTVDPVYMLILKFFKTKKFCLEADCSPTDTNDSLEAKFNFIF